MKYSLLNTFCQTYILSKCFLATDFLSNIPCSIIFWLTFVKMWTIFFSFFVNNLFYNVCVEHFLSTILKNNHFYRTLLIEIFFVEMFFRVFFVEMLEQSFSQTFFEIWFCRNCFLRVYLSNIFIDHWYMAIIFCLTFFEFSSSDFKYLQPRVTLDVFNIYLFNFWCPRLSACYFGYLQLSSIWVVFGICSWFC